MDEKTRAFADACYSQNTLDELSYALTEPADKTDCQEWGLTPYQWKNAIRTALMERMEDEEK